MLYSPKCLTDRETDKPTDPLSLASLMVVCTQTSVVMPHSTRLHTPLPAREGRAGEGMRGGGHKRRRGELSCWRRRGGRELATIAQHRHQFNNFN